MPFRYLIAILITLWPAQAIAQSAEELARKSQIEEIGLNPNDAQLARKARSIAAIKARGIPVLDHLPVIQSEEASTRRTDREVAERALALMLVAVKGETGDQALIEKVIVQYEAAGLFTPMEQAFIDNPEPSHQDRVNMSWRYEAVKTLLWALGFVDELGDEDDPADVPALAEIFRNHSLEDYYAQAKLRPQAELLDATDMIYRLHWAATDARVTGAPVPEGLHPGVVYERHYALNWLIGYLDQAWDDISTDT